MHTNGIKDFIGNPTFEKLPIAVAALYEKLEFMESLIRSQQRNEEEQPRKQIDEPDEYITRKEAAKLLKISLPTLSEWSKSGIVKSYRIATRVRYKRKDVELALKAVKVR